MHNLPFETLVILGLVMGSLGAYFAFKRGKNPYLWFAIGALLGLIGILFLFFSPVEKKKGEEKASTPPPHPFTLREWYYLTPTQESKGPLKYETLLELWKKGELSAENYVWQEEWSEWKQFSEVLKSLQLKTEG